MKKNISEKNLLHFVSNVKALQRHMVNIVWVRTQIQHFQKGAS